MTNDRAALERAVIEAARECARARPGWMPDDPRSFVGHTKSKWVLLNEALAALDASPHPEAGALTEDPPMSPQTAHWIDLHNDRHEIIRSRIDDLAVSLAELEAAGPLTTPNRLNLAEERLDRIENELHTVNGRLWKLEPPAPVPQPEAKGMTLSDRWLRGSLPDANEGFPRLMGERQFYREAREIEVAALEEARALYKTTFPGMAEVSSPYFNALDELLASKRRPA